MPQSVHFISGLPRSGSTLLSALLRQNPRFHADISTPLATLLSGNLRMFGSGTEASHLMSEKQKRAVLSAVAQAFVSTATDRQVVFDSHRRWCSHMPLIKDLFPETKVIACVRDVPWVLDSMERIIRKNPLQNSPIFSHEDRPTVYSRVAAMMRQDSLVGFAWAALKEAFYGEHAERLLVIDYELLARRPEQVLRLVYDFIGEPYWPDHDFENVVFDAPEFDTVLGLSGMHRVKPRVAFEPRSTILPPDVFAKFQGMDFWRDTTGSNANVILPTGQKPAMHTVPLTEKTDDGPRAQNNTPGSPSPQPMSNLAAKEGC